MLVWRGQQQQQQQQQQQPVTRIRMKEALLMQHIAKSMCSWCCFLVVFITINTTSSFVYAADATHDQQHHHQQSSTTMASKQCEQLQTSLTYTQEEAPRDLSGVLPVVYNRVNQLLEGVLDIAIEWTGDFHVKTGEHIVKCEITRTADAVNNDGGSKTAEFTVNEEGNIVQCFHIPFTILDTNECTLPIGHTMRHQCHESTICVNTDGSYECICPGMLSPTTASVDSYLQLPTSTSETDSFFQSIQTQYDKKNLGLWDVSFGRHSLSSCPGSPSTHSCCPHHVYIKGDGPTCRATFRCPVDPCSASTSTSSTIANSISSKRKQRQLSTKKNTCDQMSTCIRATSPLDTPNYSCSCPSGYMGNGHVCDANSAPPKPMVMYDGITPTELTIKNDMYCSCTIPIVDACSGYLACKGKHQICIAGSGNAPTCACKPGYVHHDTYGCVDESPPILNLKHDPHNDQILRLRQGDVYTEYGVEVQDENAEDYQRSLKMVYSQPIRGCLSTIGEFHVNYTVATPWTTPPDVCITRRVIIDDIDECKESGWGVTTGTNNRFETSCPSLVPRCDVEAGAVCTNTVGSYRCSCPKYTTGDGFRSDIVYGTNKNSINTTETSKRMLGIPAPVGYRDGSSCIDTWNPVISLVGPNPKIFRVCKCGGICSTGSTAGTGCGDNAKNAKLHASQQQQYETNIQALIKESAGGELCATHSHLKPIPSDCVDAYDETHTGRVDLSNKVVVGQPVKKSPTRWSVPYNVNDAAGNSAPTVWRDIVVEEVDLSTVEDTIRKEVVGQRNTKKDDDYVQRQINKALAEDRKKRTLATAASTCPVCPKNKCATLGEFDVQTMCNEAALSYDYDHKQHKDGVCTIYDENNDSTAIRAIRWFENVFPTTVVGFILFLFVIIGAANVLRVFVTVFMNPHHYSMNNPSYYAPPPNGAANGQYNDYLRDEEPHASSKYNGMTPGSSSSTSSARRRQNMASEYQPMNNHGGGGRRSTSFLSPNTSSINHSNNSRSFLSPPGSRSDNTSSAMMDDNIYADSSVLSPRSPRSSTTNGYRSSPYQ